MVRVAAQPDPAGPGAGRVDLRFRQIHLDFHTSEHIPDVARDFDPERFAATLKKAAVNSVTCFGRCHHRYIHAQSPTPNPQLPTANAR